MVAYDFESNARSPHMDAKKQMPSVTYMLTKNLYFPPSSIPADTLKPEAATVTELEGVDRPEITRKRLTVLIVYLELIHIDVKTISHEEFYRLKN